MSTVTVPKRRGRPPKAKPAPPAQEEIIQNVVSGPKSSKQKRKVPVLKGPSRSKKIANPPKKMKRNSDTQSSNDFSTTIYTER